MTAPDPRPRTGVVLWLRLLRLRVAALRWTFAPLVSGSRRDPNHRARLLDRDGGVCSVCREVTPDWQGEHTRPLGLGGRDDLRNMTTMCRRCHEVKTAAERRVLEMKRRWAGYSRNRWRPTASSLRGRIPALPWWKWVCIAAFVLGVISTHWTSRALLVLLVLGLGPGYVHSKIPRAWRKPRGPGIDGAGTWDAKLERMIPGTLGEMAGTYWNTRNRGQVARLVPLWASGCYVVGAAAHVWIFRGAPAPSLEFWKVVLWG